VWKPYARWPPRGTTPLLTTQYLDEVDQLTDRTAEGTPAELKTSVDAGTLNVRLRDPEGRPKAARLLTQRSASRCGSSPLRLIAGALLAVVGVILALRLPRSSTPAADTIA
jgi:hypothetical protein